MAPAGILAFEQNSRLCIVKHLKNYLKRTKDIRTSNTLLVSYVKQHVPVGRQTLSRRVKGVLSAAGIDTDMYSSHGTRATSCSTLTEKGVALSTIMKDAGWSNDLTFTKFYKRQNKANFGQLVLDGF